MKAHLMRGLAAAAFCALLCRPAQAQNGALAEQRRELFAQLQSVHGISGSQLAALEAIFAGSAYIGQGNPAVTHHPLSPDQCRAKVQQAGVSYENPEFTEICGDKYMAPLYDPARQRPQDAAACIDQFEFPDIPCTYPVVWVKAMEAEEICRAIGKRMCDAHEWEGGCAGALLEPDYRFDLARSAAPGGAIAMMKSAHNRKWEPTKAWSYGPQYRTGICGANSTKDAGCNGGDWARCGSNTYPTGSFPDCRSPLGVYDLNGNAAEHMNLPLNESQMTSRGSKTLGYTEMKGSWFIFDKFHAHEDWCRWRAPFWHGTKVMVPESHHNYHLGFRCCKTIERQKN